jgi:transcriptional regulator of heat shock response
MDEKKDVKQPSQQAKSFSNVLKNKIKNVDFDSVKNNDETKDEMLRNIYNFEAKLYVVEEYKQIDEKKLEKVIVEDSKNLTNNQKVPIIVEDSAVFDINNVQQCLVQFQSQIEKLMKINEENNERNDKKIAIV